MKFFTFFTLLIIIQSANSHLPKAHSHVHRSMNIMKRQNLFGLLGPSPSASPAPAQSSNSGGGLLGGVLGNNPSPVAPSASPAPAQPSNSGGNNPSPVSTAPPSSASSNGLLGVLDPVVAPVTGLASPVLAPVTSLASPVLAPVTSLANSVLAPATSLVGSAVLSPVESLASPVTSVLGSAVLSPVESAAGPVTSVLGSAVLSPVESAAGPVTSVLGSAVLSPVESAAGPVTSVLGSAVLSPVESLASPVTSAVVGIVTPLTSDVGSAVLSPVQSLASPVTSAVVGIVTPLTSDVGSAVAPVTSGVVGPLTSDVVPSLVPSAVESLVPSVVGSPVPSAVASLVPSAVDSIVGSVASIPLPPAFTSTAAPVPPLVTSIPLPSAISSPVALASPVPSILSPPNSGTPAVILFSNTPTASTSVLDIIPSIPLFSFPQFSTVIVPTSITNSAITKPTTVAIDPNLSFILTLSSLAVTSIPTNTAVSLTNPDQALSTALPVSAVPTSMLPLPSGMPARIYPADRLDPNTDLTGYTFIGILFDLELNWPFVVDSPVSPTQIFAYIPIIIATALGIQGTQILPWALQVYIPTSYHSPADAAQLGTLWLGYIPDPFVITLSQEILAKQSKFYTGDFDAVAHDLASYVNSGFNIISVSDPNSSGTKGTSADDGGKSRQDAIIGVVSSLGAIAFLFLVFLAYRVMKNRRELAHRRLSDPPDIGSVGVRPEGQEFDQDSVGGARRRSFYYAEDSLRGFQESEQITGPSMMTQRRTIVPGTLISAPVLRESSLNW